MEQHLMPPGLTPCCKRANAGCKERLAIADAFASNRPIGSVDRIGQEELHSPHQAPCYCGAKLPKPAPFPDKGPRALIL